MTNPTPANNTPRYASDGSHLRQTDRQWQDLAERSLEELANLTLATPLPDGRLQFRFLNEDIRVDIPNQRLLHIHSGNDIPLEDPLLELVTLTYLNRVDAVLPLDRDIVGLQDLKESHFFAGPHELQTDPVLERYGKDPDCLPAGRGIPGWPYDGHGGCGRPIAPVSAHSVVFPDVVCG